MVTIVCILHLSTIDINLDQFVNKKYLFYPYFNHMFHLYYELESDIYSLSSSLHYKY